jgi:hypothetical protein
MEKEQTDFLTEAAKTVIETDQYRDTFMKNLSLSIVKIPNDRDNNPICYEHLFEFVPTYEEANLLAQLAMGEKEDHELIAIFPGYNRSIKNHHPKDYADALVLAEKYKFVKIGGEKNER